MFDGNLPGNILAAKRLMARQPRGGITIALLLVGRAVNRQELKRVIGKLSCCAPVCQALLRATTWSICTAVLVPLPRWKVMRLPVYGSSSWPLATLQLPLTTACLRSRARMILRVSQPLVVAQPAPNWLRAYPVLGARPLTGNASSAANASPLPCGEWLDCANCHAAYIASATMTIPASKNIVMTRRRRYSIVIS